MIEQVVNIEFEINISSRMRRKLQVQMADHDAWMASDMNAVKLLSIFDDVIDENVMLLIESKNRFHDRLRTVGTARH